MAIVPQAVPVAMDISPAIINTITGSSTAGIAPDTAPTKNLAVPTSEVTLPIDQAKTNMVQAITMDFAPSIQVSKASPTV